MSQIGRRLSILPGAVFALLLVSCSAGVDTPEPLLAVSSDAQGLVAPPTPVAAITLDNGNIVEFYDFSWGVLISEKGDAGTDGNLGTNPATSTIPRDYKPDRVVDIWKLLAPTSPVPEKLVELQQRFIDAEQQSPTPGSEQAATGSPPTISKSNESGVHANTLQGCSNGCCDYDWMSTFGECNNAGGWNYSWFLFNYGWSGVSGGSIYRYDGLACSAVGTSTYTVSIGGAGGVWSVTEAHYRTFLWIAGTNFWGNWIYQTPTTSLNSSTNQHLSTYCGTVGY